MKSNLFTVVARSARSSFRLLVLAAAVAVGGSAPAQEPVVFGDTISEPGIYFLAGNQSGNGNGIVIESDDVLLLLTRFTLRGDGSSFGIDCLNNDNVHILGGRVTGFYIGIRMAGGENCSIEGTRVDHSDDRGILLIRMQESLLLRLRADRNREDGVDLIGSDKNRLLSVRSHDNGRDGINIGPQLGGLAGTGADSISDENKVKLCWLAYNDRNGLFLEDADDSEVERNQAVFNASGGIRLGGVADGMDPSLGEQPDALDGSQRNFLRSNWCVFNDDGLAVHWGSTDNTLTNNTALANSDDDMVDGNAAPPCENLWYLNFFLVRDGDGEACIF